MLLEHKQIINQMRQEGRSQMQIAATLGIPYNTVKSYCRRNNIIPMQNGSTKTISYKSIETAGGQTDCRNCGKPLIQALKGQPKKFCSEGCRRIWWKSNEIQSSRKAYYNLTCLGCNKVF